MTKLRLVDMAENNAYITLNNKEQRQVQCILTELKEATKTRQICQEKLKCYDISNISGNYYSCWNVCYGKWGI